MARPKKYSREEMVKRAQVGFWRHGYTNLGISLLEKETGVGRFAVRTEFGGKEGLFLAVLYDYENDLREYAIGPMQEDGTLTGVIRFLESIASSSKDRPKRRFGCLMVNTTVECVALESKAISKQVERHWSIFRNSLSELLNDLQEAGQVRCDLSIEEAVEYLIGVVIAANVLNRRARRRDGAKQFISVAVQGVRTWSHESSRESD